MKAVVCVLLLVGACQGPATLPPRGQAEAVRPMELRYHGEHTGDHRPWIYTAHVSVEPAVYEGRPAWRRSYRLENAGTKVEGTIVVDRDTPASLESQSTFGDERSRTTFRHNQVETTVVGADGKARIETIAVRGFFVTDMWSGFDLYVISLPLRPGYRTRVNILGGDRLRPFTISVERVERVRVPAGEFDAFRVFVDPLDGDDRLRSIYHVRSDGSPVVVRKQYVVNPKTEGEVKRSTGVEELEAIERGSAVAGSG
jgi:hypothetical protein